MASLVPLSVRYPLGGGSSRVNMTPGDTQGRRNEIDLRLRELGKRYQERRLGDEENLESRRRQLNQKIKQIRSERKTNYVSTEIILDQTRHRFLEDEVLVRQRESAEQLRLAKKQFASVVSKLSDRWESNSADRKLKQIQQYSQAIDVLREHRVRSGVAHQKELSVQEVLLARKAEYLLHLRAAEQESNGREQGRTLDEDALRKVVDGVGSGGAKAERDTLSSPDALVDSVPSSKQAPGLSAGAALNTFVSGVEVEHRRKLLAAIKQQTQEAVNAALSQRGFAASAAHSAPLFVPGHPMPPYVQYPYAAQPYYGAQVQPSPAGGGAPRPAP